MIRLAIFDIDGTLFDEERQEYPASAVEGLRLLRERHILTAVATGRPPFTRRVLNAAGIYPDYYVCSNGHLVLREDGSELLNEGFSPELAEEVWAYCQAHDIALLWKFSDCSYVYRTDPEFDRIFHRNRKVSSSTEVAPVTIFTGDTTIHRTRRPNGGCLACSLEKMNEFNRHFDGRCIAVDINGSASDLLLWGVNKQTGLARLLEKIGIPPGECIAFGNNRNDLEMLRFVGIGVAMGNGEDELKAHSDYVTEATDADGIYLALKHFHLI